METIDLAIYLVAVLLTAVVFRHVGIKEGFERGFCKGLEFRNSVETTDVKEDSVIEFPYGSDDSGV